MNLQQLRVLILISRYKKITSVAEVLKLKQPTVAFHMKKLENFVGLSLYESKHKRVYLTDAGQSLLYYATRIVSWVEGAEQAMTDYRHFNKGRITVGASNTPATYFFPHLLGEMQNAYPYVQISLQVKDSPLILGMLKKFEIDFGVVAEYRIDDPELIVTPLFEDELGLVLYPEHWLAHVESVSPDHLRLERWILREPGSASRRMSEEWAIQNGIEFKLNMELGTTEAIKRGVMSKLGISILSHLAVADEVATGQLLFKKIPSPFLSRSIFLVSNCNRSATPIVQDFIHLITKTGKRTPASSLLREPLL